MQINLRIERLILDGIPLSSADQAELAASLQLELGRLLSMEAGSQPWQTLDGQNHLQAGAIRYQPGSNPIHLGREIAANLHQSFQRKASEPPSEPA